MKVKTSFAAILFALLSIAVHAQQFIGSVGVGNGLAFANNGGGGGGGGQSLLAYVKGGGVNTYQLTGQVVDLYSATPWDSLSNYKTTWPNVTVSSNTASHVFDTGALPSIINVFAIAGPQCTTDGKGWYIQTAPATTTPSCTGNAAPNDWCTISQQVNASNSLLYEVLLYANPAGPGNNPWTYGGGVLTTNSATQNQLLTWINTMVVPCLKTLNKPFFLALEGELNLANSGSFAGSGPNGWLAINVAPNSASVAQVEQIIQQDIVAQGVSNFLLVFQTNLGQGNWTFGYNASIFDVIALDSNPTFWDIGAYNATTPSSGALTALGLPIMYGSMGVLSTGYPSAYTVNMYSYFGPNVGSYPSFLEQGFATYYPTLFGTIDWFQGQQYQNQCGVGQALGVPSTSFLIGTVSCSGDPTSLTGINWKNSSNNPTTFTKAGGLAGG